MIVLQSDSSKPGPINVPNCETVLLLHNSTSVPNVGIRKEDQVLPVNERIIGQWLNLVWFRHVKTPTSLLLADSFQAHTSPITQKSMVSNGACLAIIPTACSPKLQPLHRGIKHKFKVLVFDLKSLQSPFFELLASARKIGIVRLLFCFDDA